MMKDDTCKRFLFFFSQLFHLLYNPHVNGINLSLLWLRRTDVPFEFVSFYLDRIFVVVCWVFFFYFFTALITCFAMLWPIFKVKLVINTCFGERGTTMCLRRLRPVRQQSSFQLDIKMQIIQTSKYVKVKVERTLIYSVIKLKSLSTLIVPG